VRPQALEIAPRGHLLVRIDRHGVLETLDICQPPSGAGSLALPAANRIERHVAGDRSSPGGQATFLPEASPAQGQDDLLESGLNQVVEVRRFSPEHLVQGAPDDPGEAIVELAGGPWLAAAKGI